MDGSETLLVTGDSGQALPSGGDLEEVSEDMLSTLTAGEGLVEEGEE